MKKMVIIGDEFVFFVERENKKKITELKKRKNKKN